MGNPQKTWAGSLQWAWQIMARPLADTHGLFEGKVKGENRDSKEKKRVNRKKKKQPIKNKKTNKRQNTQKLSSDYNTA